MKSFLELEKNGYESGINSVWHGDCLEMMKLIPSKSIDLVVTDPPYEFHSTQGGGLSLKREWLTEIHAQGMDSFEPTVFLTEIVRICKNFHAYIFCSKNLLYKYLSFIESHNLQFEILIYAKKNPIPLKNNKYLSDKEYCLFVRDKNCYFNNHIPFEEYKTVQFVNVKKNELHPAQKDFQFVANLIKKSSKENDLILDPFAGSGTSLLAAKQLNRRFIGIEKEEKYCKIVMERLKQESLF